MIPVSTCRMTVGAMCCRLDCLHSACTLSSAKFNRRLHTLFTKNTRLFVSGTHEAKVLHESVTAAMRREAESTVTANRLRSANMKQKLQGNKDVTITSKLKLKRAASTKRFHTLYRTESFERSHFIYSACKMPWALYDDHGDDVGGADN